MSYIEHSQSSINFSISYGFKQEITHIIPITADTLLLVRANRTYELIAIRKKLVIYKSKFPEDFTPCATIKSTIPIHNKYVYLYDQNYNIYRFDPVKKQGDLRKQIQKQLRIQNIDIIVRYDVFESSGNYLLISAFNTENFNTSICIYDWSNKTFSNIHTLHRNFHNFKVLCHQSQSQNQFTLISTGENYKIIFSIAFKYIFDKAEIKAELKKQVQIGFPFVIIGGVSFNDFSYLIGNSQTKGALIIEIHNLSQQIKDSIINLDQQQKNSGLIKRFFGIQENNFIISFQQIPNNKRTSKRKLIYKIPILNINPEKQNSQFRANIISKKFLNLDSQGETLYDCIQVSIDGWSFHKYWMPMNKLLNQSISQGIQGNAFIHANILFAIPKNYFYAEIADHIGLSDAFTSQIIKLL